MAFGLSVSGAAGNVQIDQSFMNMCFLGKGSITLGAEQTSGSTPVLQRAFLNGFGEAATAPGARMCAFRARSSDKPVGVWRQQGDRTEFVGRSSNPNDYPIVDWWVFGQAPESSTAFGVKSFDASGNVLWSASGRPMKIATAKSDVIAITNDLYASVAGDYAICVGQPLGGVRSGTETSVGSGNYSWIETRPMWGYPDATGFPHAITYPAKKLTSFSYPTGWREGDIRASLLLVDISGL